MAHPQVWPPAPKYRPLAWIADDETLLPKPGLHNVPATFQAIYIDCPPQCRYAVVLDQADVVKVIDVYKSDVGVMTPKPVFVDRVFENYDHACATMRVLYEVNPGLKVMAELRHAMRDQLERMTRGIQQQMTDAVWYGTGTSNPGGLTDFLSQDDKQPKEPNK